MDDCKIVKKNCCLLLNALYQIKVHCPFYIVHCDIEIATNIVHHSDHK